MMKERLRDLNIKTTELAEYMRLSRPSIYKYLDFYDSKRYKDVPEKVLRTFKYIDRSKNLTKGQIISFIIYEFADLESSDRKETIRSYLLAKGPNDPKIELMHALITTDELDVLVPMLSNTAKILDGGVSSESEIYQVARFVNLRSNIMKNVPLSAEELEHARLELGV